MRGWRCVFLAVLSVVLLTACAARGAPQATSAPNTGAVITQNNATPTASVFYTNDLLPPLPGWSHTSTTYDGSDGYHIVGAYIAFAPLRSQTDVSVSVDARQISGPTHAFYGITFRYSPKNRYEFDIDSSGEWYVLQDQNGVFSNLIAPAHNSAILVGPKMWNTLKVVAQGSHFTFFVNGQFVGQLDDSTHPSGLIGLDGDYNAEVVFTNIEVDLLG